MLFSQPVFANTDMIGNCAASNQKIQQLLNQYSLYGLMSDPIKTDATFKELHELIFNHHDQSGDDPCYEQSLNTYATLAPLVDATRYMDLDPKIRPLLPPEEFGSKTPWAADAVATLIRKNKLIFLTPENRRKLGGKWNELTPEGEYTSVGAYDCMTSIVYVDPTLRPLDFSITLIHELDHVYRDKFMDGFDYPKGTAGNWEAINFIDEVEAILTGAQKWAGMKTQITVKHAVFGNKAQFAFNLQHDGTLYNGPAMNAMYAGLHFSQEFAMMAMEIHSTARDLLLTEVRDAYFPDTENPTLKAMQIEPESYEWFPRATNASARQWTSLEVKLNQPSLSCENYVQSLKLGPVSQYVGAHFSDENTDHPSLTLRPCLRHRY